MAAMNQEIPQSLSTRKKVAIVLASLDRQTAAGVMRNLSPRCVGILAAEIRNLREISPDMRNAAFSEVAIRIAGGARFSGGEEVARALLQEVAGDSKTAEEMLEQALDEHPTNFTSLLKLQGRDLASILRKEQPATAAIILAFLPPWKSAEIIPHFDSGFRRGIITRLARARTADPAMVQRIESIFVDKVMSVLSVAEPGERNSLGGPSFVAKLLNHLPRSSEQELLGCIHDDSPELATEIREQMLTFDDIINLGAQDIQRVLRDVPVNDLVVALRGVKEEILDKVTSNLSKNARENLLEEMQLMGKVRRREIETEQRKIAALMRDLAGQGAIDLASGEDNGDEMV